MTDQKKLMAVCGHMDQIAGVRQMEFQDGRAAGLRCAMIHNGPLELPLMLDKCLDPAWIRYKGINLSLLTKPGLQGRNPYDTAGDEAVRSIMGGAMFTCGLGNVHGNRVVDGVEYPVHGRMRTTPAEKISMDAFWENGEYKILVSGEMREARIFGENLVLRRTVETVYGKNEIVFTDEIENQGFEDQPLCFLYHCNAGYPFLVPGLRVVMPSIFCSPRDADAKAGEAKWNVMEEPVKHAPEQVFQHELAADHNGNTFAAFVNDELQIGLCIRFEKAAIPYLTQWKSLASGDFAMALEPTNCGFDGRAGATEILKPFEKHVNRIRFQILDGEDEIELLEHECREVLECTM